MLLTEDRARGKWCPHSRQVAVVCNDAPVVAVTANRDAGNHYGVENCRCIASECMAWRWEPADAFEARQDAYHDAANIGGLNVIEEPHPRGFCGLAGKVGD